ncbi:sensor histidine kinase [Cohnella nanjingensis]|nr:HAMP domain-containing sensor histidine kinase [Cohnella nanjingensis]
MLQYSGYHDQRGLAKYRYAIALVCGLSSVLCMLIPVVNADGFRWDLGAIPIGVAVLYGGRLPGAAAALIYAAANFATADGRFAAEMLSLAAALLYPYIGSGRYARSNLSVKLIGGLGASIAFYFVTLNLVLYLSDSFDASLRLDRLTFIVFQFLVIVALPIVLFLVEKQFVWAMFQERLRQAERLNMIGEMAASIAHEVRNPLTVVKGFLQLLSSSNDEKTRLYMTTSIAELDRAEFIISDYLNMAKNQPEERHPLDVCELVETAVQTMTPFAVMQSIELRHLCERDHYVQGDTVKFKQVIINVVKNAIEAMPGGGIIEVQSFRQEDEVIVKVLDNGEGMTQEQLGRLGSPYFSAKEKGTGLGTMVVFRIVESMGGKITYRSEKGKGTQVVMQFPAAGEG